MYNRVKIYSAVRNYKSWSKQIDFVLNPPDKTDDFKTDYNLKINIRDRKDKLFFHLNADEANRLKNVLTQFIEQSKQTIAIMRKCNTCKWLEKQKKKDLFF